MSLNMKCSCRESWGLVMSDLHYGKRTLTFNPDIFARRLSVLLDKLAITRELVGNRVVDSITLFVLGDVNDGTGIFPGQEHHQAETDVRAQARGVARLLTEFACGSGRIFPKVEIACVAGNHGRAGKFAHQAANWDLVAYDYWQDFLDVKLGEGAVRIDYPRDDENPFMRQIRLCGHELLLYHGQAIKSYQSVPWYGIMQRLLRWKSTGRFRDARAALFGHFHTNGWWPFNQLEVILTGTMVQNDEWALENFGWESRTSWMLFGADERRPVNWAMPIELY